MQHIHINAAAKGKKGMLPSKNGEKTMLLVLQIYYYVCISQRKGKNKLFFFSFCMVQRKDYYII